MHFDNARRIRQPEIFAGSSKALWFLLCVALTSAVNAQAPRLVVPIGHTSVITDASFSPDGSKIVTASDDFTAKVWDATSGRELLSLRGHQGAVWTASFSPDGTRIVTASNDNTAKLWDAKTGKDMLTLTGHQSSVLTAAFSPDSKRVVTGAGDNTARVWDARTGVELFRIGKPRKSNIRAFFSPDGTKIFTSSNNKKIEAFDARTGIEDFRWRAQTELSIDRSAFGVGSSTIVAAASDNTALVFDTRDRHIVVTFKGHQKAVNSAAFSPDGTRVVTASDDGTARLWDSKTGLQLLAINEMGQMLQNAEFSPDGSRIVLATADKVATVWDAKSGRQLLSLGGDGGEIFSASFCSQGSKIVSGGEDFSASHRMNRCSRIWSATGEAPEVLGVQSGITSNVAFSPDCSRVLATAYEDGTSLRDASSGKKLISLDDHKGDYYAAFSPDGKRFVTASPDRTAAVWDAMTGERLLTLIGHTDSVQSANFSTDGTRIVTASQDKTARIWDARTGKEILRLTGHTAEVNTAAFSPDAREIVSASNDGTAAIWDARNGKRLLTLSGGGNWLYSASFSPDGTSIVAACGDNTAGIWDARGGKRILTLHGQDAWLSSATFSPDGTRIVTASCDGTIAVWDVRTGHEYGVLTPLGDLGWACETPEGWFDASPAALKAMYWVIPGTLETIDLDQVKERNWRPGLLKSIILGEKLPPAPPFPIDRLQPIATVEPPGNGSTVAKIHLQGRSGGIGKVTLYVGDTPIEIDPKSQGIDSHAKEATLSVDVKNYLVPGEENSMWARVSNADSSLTGRSGIATARALPTSVGLDDSLYVLAIGTGDYQNKELHLNLPPKDAADLVHAAMLGGEKLFSGNVHATLLTTDSSLANGVPNLHIGKPTKKEIKAAFDEIERDAKPQDTVLIFFSGHGVTYKKGDNTYYCYLTSDATTGNMQDDDVRKSQGVSMDDLVEWMVPSRDGKSGIRAQRRVLVLDTCAAGEAVANLALQRDADQDVVKAHELFKDKTGFWVLAGSAADAVSYEAGEFGHGLLSYALLLGLSGAGLDGDRADVDHLFKFSQTEVENLVKGRLGAVQTPQVFAMNTSFPIGLYDDAERKQIIPGEARTRILRPETFVDINKGYDSLNLTKALTEKLEEQNEASVRGESVKTWFVNADELEGAITPAGSYTVDANGNIVVTLVLLDRSKKNPETSSQKLSGQTSDLSALIIEIVDAINAVGVAPK